MRSPLLKDVFDIPEYTGTEDYVLRLTDSITGRGATEAIDDYVVTPQLQEAFDRALGLVSDALGTGKNRGAFLTGSFGSGKSHFMAVLHALLRHQPHARELADLQGVIARHDPTLQGKKILPLAFHFLDAQSMEQELFDSYVAQVQTLHPDAPLPAFYASDELLRNADDLRDQIGDAAFFSRLGAGSAESDDPWADLMGSDTWDSERYERARSASPTSAERQDLVTVLVETYFSSYTRHATYVDIDTGLAAMSNHAQSLGYDAVVLFLDELVLWLAFAMQDHGTFGREAQKISKLVEGDYGRLPIPLISVIARQMNLRRWFADSGSSGSQQEALDSAFRHQEGRFATIELGDDNLAYVAARRLLRPRDAEAAEAIEYAFRGIDRAEGVWDVLLDGVNVDERHRGADEELFRLTYPFSPALVSTLRSLSSVMQRDRTALKVMQQMLVDRRSTMTIDDVIPVGDAYPYIVAGKGDSVLDPKAAALFRSAEQLYTEKLRDQLLDTNGLSVADIADEDALPAQFAKDRRLAHTLLLSAVAPNVPALKGLTASRLASLNHGSIVSPLPGGEANVALSKVRSWSTRVPEIRVGADPRNPVIEVQLSDIDFESIVDKAKVEDNPGRQREMLRGLFAEAAGLELGEAAIDGSYRTTIVWRGSERIVDILFGNVRDAQEVPEDRLRSATGTWKLVVDLPFDEPGRSPEEDVRRVDDLLARNTEFRTLIWLPRFLSDGRRRDLSRLVILDWLLTGHGDRWRQYSDHLSEADRGQAKVILEGQLSTLRTNLRDAVEQAYGAATPEPGVLQDGGLDQVLWSLDRTHTPRTPAGPSLVKAFDQIVQAAWDSTYPDHPAFQPPEDPVRIQELKAVLEHVDRAVAHPDHRVPLEKNIPAVRRVANALKVGRAAETHFLFWEDTFGTWPRDITQGLAAKGFDEQGNVTVDQLRTVLRGTDTGRGLRDEVLDVVIIAWAALRQRAWFERQASIEVPPPGRLHDAMELRRQEMPTDDEWERASDRAGTIFGVAARPFLTAVNVNSLAEAIAGAAAELNEPAQRLLSQLREAHHERDLTTSDRLTTADEAASLVDTLRSLKGLPLVRHLAQADLSGSDAEVAASLRKANEAAAALGRFEWDRLAKPTAARELVNARGREAARILDEFDRALAGQEFSRSLKDALSTVESETWRWMASGTDTSQPSGPKPRTTANPEESQPRHHGATRTVTWTSGANALREVEDEISRTVESGARIEITWSELE